MTKPQRPKVADAEPEVDTYNEQHIIPEPFLLNQELRDPDNVIHALNGLCRVLLGKLTLNSLCGRCNKPSLQFPAAFLHIGNVDDAFALGPLWKHDDLRHDKRLLFRDDI